MNRSSGDAVKKPCSKHRLRKLTERGYDRARKRRSAPAKNILAHGEKLHQGCRDGEELLYEGDAAIVGGLSKYTARFRELATIDHNLQPTVELLESSLAQLQEAAAALRRYAERVHFDPRALEQIEDRLAEIQRLKRKYNGSVDDILRMHEEIKSSLSGLERGEEQMAGLEKAFVEARQGAWEHGGEDFSRAPASRQEAQARHGKRSQKSRHAGDHV